MWISTCNATHGGHSTAVIGASKSSHSWWWWDTFYMLIAHHHWTSWISSNANVDFWTFISVMQWLLMLGCKTSHRWFDALPPSSNSMPVPLLWSWSIDNPAHAEQCFVALFNEYNLPELIFWIPEFQSIIKCHQYSINACNVTVCNYSGTTDLKSSYVLAACRWVPESFLVAFKGLFGTSCYFHHI